MFYIQQGFLFYYNKWNKIVLLEFCNCVTATNAILLASYRSRDKYFQNLRTGPHQEVVPKYKFEYFITNTDILPTFNLISSSVLNQDYPIFKTV